MNQNPSPECFYMVHAGGFIYREFTFGDWVCCSPANHHVIFLSPPLSCHLLWDHNSRPASQCYSCYVIICEKHSIAIVHPTYGEGRVKRIFRHTWPPSEARLSDHDEKTPPGLPRSPPPGPLITSSARHSPSIWRAVQLRDQSMGDVVQPIPFTGTKSYLD